MDKVYKIIWHALVQDLLLISIRKPTIKHLINSLLTVIVDLHSQLIKYRKHSLYRVSHGSQIASMEAVMNDHFDKVHRRIRIVNSEFKTAVYFYEPEENKEIYFYEPEENKQVYFYEEDDLAGDGVDFIVCVPPALKPLLELDQNVLLTQMRGQLDYYKLYSKNYKIVWEQVNP